MSVRVSFMVFFKFAEFSNTNIKKCDLILHYKTESNEIEFDLTY